MPLNDYAGWVALAFGSIGGVFLGNWLREVLTGIFP
jgi:hypothetical protein